MKLATLKELYDKVKAGEIDEEKLTVVMDNDCTSFYLETDGEDDGCEIDVTEANGYRDIAPLYALLFSKATIEWC